MAGRPRIRFRRPRGDQQQAEDASAATTQHAANGEGAPTPPASAPPSVPGKAPAAPQAGGSTASRPRSGAQGAASKPSADPQERIDGLRAWLADLDRKLAVRTYIGAALAVLVLAAAGASIYLTLSLKHDAATKDDLNALRDQLSSVEQFAATAAHRGVRSLDQRLADLETRVDKLSTDQTTSKRELQVIQDDIKELRSQVSGGTGTSGTGGFGTGGGTGAGTGIGGSGTGTGTGGGSAGAGAGTGGTGQ
jgi:hypothetical protein